MNSASSAQSPVRTAPQSFDSLANAPFRKDIRRSLDITTRTRRSLDFNALSPVRASPAPQVFDILANAPLRENIRRSLDTTTRTRRSLDFSLDLALPKSVKPVPEVPTGILKTPTRSKISSKAAKRVTWAPIRKTRENRKSRRSSESAFRAPEAPSGILKTPPRSKMSPKASKRVTWAPIRKTRENRESRRSSESVQPSALSLANWNPNAMKSLVVTLIEMPSGPRN
ncbi:unnamed protein product [Caenorhabditis auriculariae]|uniref:Uncharacterized protein n=1 Tax=Caenorhabditis auriculariae TaxID=2777116 RepID=A0A8S1GS80_9PELO|nr:unnamed protein product [Caenorhabditis auriculariae]